MSEDEARGITATTDGYDAIAERYDSLFGSTNPFYDEIENREKLALELAAPLATKQQRALDVGCGTGFYTEYLVTRGYVTTAIDPSRGMLDMAKDKSRQWGGSVEFVQCRDESLCDFKPQSFDVVICLGSTLNHIADWKNFVSNVSRILTLRGSFVFGFENQFGADALRGLISIRGSGSTGKANFLYFSRRFLDTARGRRSRNIWKYTVPPNKISELELYHYPTRYLLSDLKRSGLKLVQIHGVHFLTCLNTRMLQTSGNLETTNKHACESRLYKLLLSMDRILPGWCYRFSAHVVGFATKTDAEDRFA